MSFRIFSPGEGNGRIVRNADGDTMILGYDESDGIHVPNPPKTLPKPGHWRVRANAKVRGKPLKRHMPFSDNPLHAARVDGDYVGEDMRAKRTRRERQLALLGELVDAGHVSMDALTPREREAMGA